MNFFGTRSAPSDPLRHLPVIKVDCSSTFSYHGGIDHGGRLGTTPRDEDANAHTKKEYAVTPQDQTKEEPLRWIPLAGGGVKHGKQFVFCGVCHIGGRRCIVIIAILLVTVAVSFGVVIAPFKFIDVGIII